jgi:hypothetical protein
MGKVRRIVVRLSAVVVAALALVLFTFAIQRFCGIPPQDSTRAHMWGIKRRVLRFAHENGELPCSLKNLPTIPGLSSKITDWWGNPIQFAVDFEGIATLRSPGGKVWGYRLQEGAPLVCKFPTKKPTGEWSDELVDFIQGEQGGSKERGEQ